MEDVKLKLGDFPVSLSFQSRKENTLFSREWCYFYSGPFLLPLTVALSVTLTGCLN